MKKLTTKTLNNPKVYTERSRSGFTLIELMVVISIIAILSIIGITIFAGVQKNARDAARKADIEAQVKALEANKLDSGYVPFRATMFADGAILDKDQSNYPYCIATSATAVPATPANSTGWTTLACVAGYSLVSTSVPAATTQYWKVCARMDDASVFCLGNTQ